MRPLRLNIFFNCFLISSIDTPGVITRVSNLFNGHPELIEGFNTFLPPGYKIEVKPSDQGNAYQVSVSIPSPTQSTATVVHTTQGINKSGLASPPTIVGTIQSTAKQSGQVQIIPSSTIIHTTMPSSTHTQAIAVATAAASIPAQHQSVATLPQSSPVQLSTPVNIHASYQQTVNSVANVPQSSPAHNNNSIHHISQTAAVCQALSQVEAANHGNPQNQRVEFNHAINYVNKIKNRFQNQPEKYKRFLEILHTYQKEQRGIKESSTSSLAASLPGHDLSVVAANLGGGGKHLTEAEVYSQVAELFENHKDLLAEFGQFLPDATSSFVSIM